MYKRLVTHLLKSSTLSMEGTFHRRELKPPAIGFSSPEGRAIFMEALALGHMESYFHLAEQFTTQKHPAYCGIGSMTMVLNALLIDPKRKWQGVWRWFDDEMLDCCEPLDDIRVRGISMPKLTCLGRCNGALVNRVHASTVSVEDFRRAVMKCTSSRFDGVNGSAMIVSYSRRKLNQTGDGHFSPIGGYHPGKDMVLIMDVARFKYPPHWVPLSQLFCAMHAIDPATNMSRGYLEVSISQELRDTLAHKCDAGQCSDIQCNILCQEIANETVRTTDNVAISDDVNQAVVDAIAAPIQALAEHHCEFCDIGNSPRAI